MKKAWMHWSGGKDSAYTLWKAVESGEFKLDGLVTNLSEEFRRVSMHGVKEELLDAQARALNLSVKKIFLPQNCSMQDYDDIVIRCLRELKNVGAETHLFGDIYLEDLKVYRESLIEKASSSAAFPIWNEANTAELARRILESGVKALVVCVSGKFFDKSWLGREYDEAFLNDLPSGVDPCGENGEFHTFVYDSPLFAEPIPLSIGESVERTYTPNEEGEEDCDCCQTWDTEFYFQELSLKQ